MTSIQNQAGGQPMRQRRTLLVRNELGQGAVTLAVVAVVLVAAVGLLLRTATLASEIDTKITNIAKSGKGINEATDAILELTTTNTLGKSILETSKPLAGSLEQIVQVAGSIDGLAASINGTAIEVNGTAKGINGNTTTILGTAKRINTGVEQINRNVDTLIDLARRVKTDTGNILTQARAVQRNTACIDQALNSPQPDCR